MILHAGLITLYSREGWRGVLIEGPSGAGKSDLALRALPLGFKAVSDDRTQVWTCEGKLFGTCPPAILGLIEARGLGVLPMPSRRLSQIDLLVMCEPQGQAIERTPDLERRRLLGVELPVLRLHALEASAPVKLLWSLSRLGARP